MIYLRCRFLHDAARDRQVTLPIVRIIDLPRAELIYNGKVLQSIAPNKFYPGCHFPDLLFARIVQEQFEDRERLVGNTRSGMQL